MTAPNIVNVASLYGKTTYFTPSGTSAVVLLANPANSNKVLKINQIVASNIDGTNQVDASVAIYTNGGQSQGSTPSGGSAYAIASTISVPADATLIIVDKSTSFYLEEDKSISITSGTASKLTFMVSYEEIS